MQLGIPDLLPASFRSPSHTRQPGDRFGRLFGMLPPLYTAPEVLMALGSADGPMVAAQNTPKTKTVPVGHVFFGQFIDHDITLDIETAASWTHATRSSSSGRAPTLDLDSVYGSGPDVQPYLYAGGDAEGGRLRGAKLRSGESGGTLASHDLVRTEDGVAVIGDFRNDENRVLSQLHLGMCQVHNKFVDELAAEDRSLFGRDLYRRARRATTWHYQWAVVHDFLVDLCGASIVNEVLSGGRRHYQPALDDTFIPVEFAVAAFRFGHSMAPRKIQVQRGGPAEDLYGGNLGSFDAIASAAEMVEWPQVFRLDETRWQRAERCDARLPRSFLNLPFTLSGEAAEVRSLATQNLLRGQNFLLPSGESVAREMGRPTAEIEAVSKAAVILDDSLATGTPLWIYCLLEGQVLGRGGQARERGEGLGPVGGRIVAETLIGVLEADSRSWLGSNRSWRPASGRGSIGELLQWAKT